MTNAIKWAIIGVIVAIVGAAGIWLYVRNIPNQGLENSDLSPRAVLDQGVLSDSGQVTNEEASDNTDPETSDDATTSNTTGEPRDDGNYSSSQVPSKTYADTSHGVSFSVAYPQAWIITSQYVDFSDRTELVTIESDSRRSYADGYVSLSLASTETTQNPEAWLTDHRVYSYDTDQGVATNPAGFMLESVSAVENSTFTTSGGAEGFKQVVRYQTEDGNGAEERVLIMLALQGQGGLVLATIVSKSESAATDVWSLITQTFNSP